jgi:hypothetical protein
MSAILMDGYAAYVNAQAIVGETTNAVHAANEPNTTVSPFTITTWSYTWSV